MIFLEKFVRQYSSFAERSQAFFLFQDSMNQGSGECTLKYLGFFPAAFSSVRVYASTIYEAAKDQSGPLRPGVEDVEEVLKAVVRPVLRIAEEQSIKLLDFADKKVDEKLKVVGDHIPSFVKPISSYAQNKFNTAKLMKSLNAKSFGVDGPASSHEIPYDKEVHSDYWTYKTIEKFIGILHLQEVVRMLGPHAIYSAQLFNQFAGSLKDANVPFSGLIPNLPVHILEQALHKGSAIVSRHRWQTSEAAC